MLNFIKSTSLTDSLLFVFIYKSHRKRQIPLRPNHWQIPSSSVYKNHMLLPLSTIYIVCWCLYQTLMVKFNIMCLNESHLAGSSLNHWLIRLRLSNIMSIWITLLMPISLRSRFDMFLRFSKTSNPFLRKLSWYWGRFKLFSHSPTGCAC